MDTLEAEHQPLQKKIYSKILLKDFQKVNFDDLFLITLNDYK